MKKLFGLFIAMIMIVSCFAALADDPIVLTYAEVNPIEDKTVVGNVALDFKAKLEELSGGQIQVDLQGSGVLGSEAQVLAGVLSQDGTVDIVRISAFALNQYGCTKSVFLSLPYVFTSEDHYWNFVHSDLAKEFLAEPTEKGMPLKGLAYGEEGFRHFFFKKEVHEIADLKDMKIRVSDDPIMQGLVKGLGANPTTVSFGELYTALQSGVVDAAEQPSGNYLSNSFQEVAPYLLKDGHTLGTIELIATQTGLNKLNEEQIGWVQEAADYAMIKCQETVVRLQEEAEATLTEKGATIIEVEDKTPWVEACKQVITDNTKGLEADLEAILALQ